MTDRNDVPDSGRRQFAFGMLAAGVGLGLPATATIQGTSRNSSEKGAMKIELPPLPYGESDLAPHISANTIAVHYGKHHLAYVNNTKKMVEGTEWADADLEAIVKASFGKPDKKALFNNAAQAWNHAFYWKSMSPKGGGAPSGKLLDRIKTDLGGFDALKQELSKAAVSQFGSGWAWLVLDAGKLKVEQSSNADTPLAQGRTPLLTIDVWEHAYYLDYQNRRPDYVTAFIDKLVNWEFAAQNLG